MTGTPSCGRDFKTIKDARDSWNAGQDWIITDLFHKYDGKPINKAQLSNEPITLRFCNNRKIAVIS